MPERVLSTPLSGLEIRKAILDRIGNSLSKDCFLSENLAYDYYVAEIHIKLTAHDVGRAAEVEQTITDTRGEVSDDVHLEAAEADIQIEAQPPNTVRVESGQDVPVLTKDSEGKSTIKGARYARGKTQIVK